MNAQRRTVAWLSAIAVMLTISGIVFWIAIRQLPSKKPGWTTTAAEAAATNPLPANEATLAAGKTVFARNCLLCHGDTGAGDGPMSAMFHPAPRDLRNPGIVSETDGELFWKISTGRKPMPAFDQTLDENQRWSVVHYVRKLQASAATEPK